MFNGKSFNEKFLLPRKYHDFARAINCTRKLACVPTRARAIERVSGNSMFVMDFVEICIRKVLLAMNFFFVKNLLFNNR